VFNTCMSSKAQAGLLQALSPVRSKGAYMQLRALGGAVDDLAVEKTAFPHRQATIDIQVQCRRHMREFLYAVPMLCLPACA
jgi:hypothetical protein